VIGKLRHLIAQSSYVGRERHDPVIDLFAAISDQINMRLQFGVVQEQGALVEMRASSGYTAWIQTYSRKSAHVGAYSHSQTS